MVSLIYLCLAGFVASSHAAVLSTPAPEQQIFVKTMQNPSTTKVMVLSTALKSGKLQEVKDAVKNALGSDDTDFDLLKGNPARVLQEGEEIQENTTLTLFRKVSTGDNGKLGIRQKEEATIIGMLDQANKMSTIESSRKDADAMNKMMMSFLHASQFGRNANHGSGMDQQPAPQNVTSEQPPQQSHDSKVQGGSGTQSSADIQAVVTRWEAAVKKLKGANLENFKAARKEFDEANEGAKSVGFDKFWEQAGIMYNEEKEVVEARLVSAYNDGIANFNKLRKEAKLQGGSGTQSSAAKKEAAPPATGPSADQLRIAKAQPMVAEKVAKALAAGVEIDEKTLSIVANPPTFNDLMAAKNVVRELVAAAKQSSKK